MRKLVSILVTCGGAWLGAQSATSAASTPEQLFEARRFAEARAGFQARLSKNGNDAQALYYMGRIAAAEDHSGEAVDWFEKAVARNDTSALYHLWLGNALGTETQRASKFRQPFLARRVRSEFERAVALDPRSIDARLSLVDFYSVAPGIMGGSMDKAKEQAAAIEALNAAQGHFARARIAERMKDTTAAEREFKSAIAAAPDSLIARFALAAFYRRYARWSDAFATYESVIASQPDNTLARGLWGITAAQSGTQMERGERELKFYLTHIPADASPITISAVHYRLGQLYERTARREAAKLEYAEALKVNPRNSDAKKALDALK